MSYKRNVIKPPTVGDQKSMNALVGQINQELAVISTLFGKLLTGTTVSSSSGATSRPGGITPGVSVQITFRIEGGGSYVNPETVTFDTDDFTGTISGTDFKLNTRGFNGALVVGGETMTFVNGLFKGPAGTPATGYGTGFGESYGDQL